MQVLFCTVIAGCIMVLAVTITLCLFKAIIGPRLIDRIIAGNMIGVKIIAVIAMLAVLKEEWYLLDICLVYAMISFLAIVVLTMIIQKPCDKNFIEQLRCRHIRTECRKKEEDRTHV